MRLKFILYAILICAVGQGCNIINPTEPIPTYIHIDSFIYTNASTDPADVGGVGTSHAITSAWVYYNNNAIGNFILPANVPIIASGHGLLQIAPGVVLNGLSSFQGLYPFYRADTSSFDAAPGKVINYTPKTEYILGLAKFPWYCDFQTAPAFTVYDSGGVNLIKPPGANYGTITITIPGDSTEVISTKGFPITAGASYCELDYKSNMPMSVGMMAVSGGLAILGPYYIIGLNETPNWQKIYISLINFTTLYPADTYYLVFKAALPPGQASGTVYLSNIKIVTY